MDNALGQAIIQISGRDLGGWRETHHLSEFNIYARIINMNSKASKRLRRKIMEDYSHEFRKYITGPNGERLDLGPRGRYKKAKRQHMLDKKSDKNNS